MTILAQFPSFSARALRFGQSTGDAPRPLTDAERVKADYFGISTELDPQQVREELANALQRGPGGALRKDYFQKSTSIPDVDTLREQLGKDLVVADEPASIDLMLAEFRKSIQGKGRPYTVDWGAEAPVPKVESNFRRMMGGFEPVYPFLLDRVSATVTLNSDQPGPVRAWRYEKDGRSHRVVVLYENPTDKGVNYILFEDKVSNFHSALRKHLMGKTDRAFRVFLALNKFLFDNYQNPGGGQDTSVKPGNDDGWGDEQALHDAAMTSIDAWKKGNPTTREPQQEEPEKDLKQFIKPEIDPLLKKQLLKEKYQPDHRSYDPDDADWSYGRGYGSGRYPKM